MHESPVQHKRPASSETVSKADSGSGPASGSGSGSSSGGSGETARPPPPETITFTFSSKSSPFAHLSPPGSVSFVSKNRTGSESSRDRPHRRQLPPPPLPPGWISLSPLKPVADISPPLFPADSKRTTAVFASSSNAKQSPRLSLVAQHRHATSPHPLFDAPPHLITPPPSDPFRDLTSGGVDSYFPPVPRQKHSKSRSKSTAKIEQPQPRHLPSQPAPTTRSSSRALTIKPSQSQTTPRVPPGSGRIPLQESSNSTPKRLQSRKSTPPQSRPSPQSQPSIAVFRDCFGVLTEVENVFPTRKERSRSASRSQSRSRSGSGVENVPGVGSGSGPSEFQKRWTRRWLRRTVRGVGSMGSGSTSSGGSGRMTGGRRLGSGGGSGGGMRGGSLGSGMGTPSSGSGNLLNAVVNLGMRALAAAQGDGSQDSLDRVRVSRSNAPSPTAATIASSEADLDAGGNEAPAIAAAA